MRAGVTRSPGLEEVLRAAVDGRLFDVHTALPAKVEKYDAAEQKIDAKPLLKRAVITEDGEEVSESLPVITDVPVVFPRGGGFFISLPIAQGDHVLLVFNERSIDKFVAGGGEEVDPVDVRMHDLSDPVAIPGFYPFSNALGDADSEDLVIAKEGGVRIHVKQDEIHLGEKDAAEFVALADKTDQRISDLETAVSDIVNNHANAHTHIVTLPLIPAGAAPSAPGLPPAVPPTPGSSVAATKVKAT